MGYVKKLKEKILPVSRRIFKRELDKQTPHFEYIEQRIDAIYKKLSMPNDIWQVKDIRFFVPNYPLDGIQRIIVNEEQFYEQDILDELSQYMPKNPVILDIGSNIGNHSLYWLSHNNAKFIYCFEPRPETFQILKKNIEINHYTEQVECFDLALSEKEVNLSTKHFEQKNIGANAYFEDTDGETASIPLDKLQLTRKIDFIKIDVEGMEISVLRGAKKTIQDNLPVIFLETFDQNRQEVHSLLTEMGYKVFKEFRDFNYLYLPASKDA